MAPNLPTRRIFIQGQPAVREFAEAVRQSDPPPAEPDKIPHGESGGLPLAQDRSSLTVSIRRRAMACEWEVQIAADRDDNSMELIFAALDLVEALEAQMTVYRAASEVMRINERAVAGPVTVESRLFNVFQGVARICRETGRALDITSGPLSAAWGFSRRQGRVPSEAEISAALALVGIDQILLDEANETIFFRRPGVSVNLNSVGKGYALDRMAELLADGNVDDYLLHGGKSSVLARGDQPGRAGHGWTIGVRHPLRPAERLAEFCLRDQCLSTSGSGTQFFQRRGKRYGHILDPRTGRPAEGKFSATVIAPTATEAEALSTAFYVMDPTEVAAYCAARPELGALLVCPAEREGDVQLISFGLDDEQWQQLVDH